MEPRDPASQTKIRIMLADGHHNVRSQMRGRLNREQDFEVVAEAACPSQNPIPR